MCRADATSSTANPRDLKSVISLSESRPPSLPSRRSPISPLMWSSSMAPSFLGKRKSPASFRVDSRRSTKSLDFTIAGVSSSRAKGTLDPTALMWVPGEIHSPFKMGSVADETVQIISAPSTASLTVSNAFMGVRLCAEAWSANFWAFLNFRLQTRTPVRLRAIPMASRWVRACTPDPNIASSAASFRASNRVATPLTAAVRMAVILPASITASRRPFWVSNSITVP